MSTLPELAVVRLKESTDGVDGRATGTIVQTFDGANKVLVEFSEPLGPELILVVVDERDLELIVK